MSLAECYKKPLTEWTDGELIAHLTERYSATIIPPCVVCGGLLTVARQGGNEPTVWACAMQENDPERVGYLRYKEGRGGSQEYDADGHYRRSQFVDDRQGGDAAVMLLIYRYRLLQEGD